MVERIIKDMKVNGKNIKFIIALAKVNYIRLTCIIFDKITEFVGNAVAQDLRKAFYIVIL